MAYKLFETAQTRWRAVDAPHLVALVRNGAISLKGKLLECPTTSHPQHQKPATEAPEETSHEIRSPGQQPGRAAADTRCRETPRSSRGRTAWSQPGQTPDLRQELFGASFEAELAGYGIRSLCPARKGEPEPATSTGVRRACMQKGAH